MEEDEVKISLKELLKERQFKFKIAEAVSVLKFKNVLFCI
jgi:hypothetical protein